MTYQDYTNFSEYASSNVGRVTNLGFINFTQEHTLWVAAAVIVLFVGYKIFFGGSSKKKYKPVRIE